MGREWKRNHLWGRSLCIRIYSVFCTTGMGGGTVWLPSFLPNQARCPLENHSGYWKHYWEWKNVINFCCTWMPLGNTLTDESSDRGGQKMLRLLSTSSQFHSEWGKFSTDKAKLTRWGVGPTSGSYWSVMGGCEEGHREPSKSRSHNISPLRLLAGHPRPPKTPHCITASWLPIPRS